MGTTADQPSPPGPIQIDVGRIMERIRSSSEGIVKIVALIEDMLARANPDATTTEWNLVAAPMLRDFQQDLLHQQHQMALYAEAVNPDSVEFHTAQANIFIVERLAIKSSTYTFISLTPPCDNPETSYDTLRTPRRNSSCISNNKPR